MPAPDAVAQFRRLARNLDPFPAAKLGGLTAPGPEATGPAVGDGPFWPWIAGGLVALTALGLLSVPRLRSGRGRV